MFNFYIVLCMSQKSFSLRIKTSVFVLVVSILPLISQTVHHWETAVYNSDTWKYLVPKAAVASTWTALSFDDSSWLSGVGGFGYKDGDDGTVIWTSADGAVPLSVFMRIKFNVTDTAKLSVGAFHIDYDDAFIAYLNGIEIARVGLTGTNPPYNQLGVNHDAVMFEGGDPDVFVLTKKVLTNCIKPGSNVLSIQVHNSSASSSDMTSNAFLSFGFKDATTYYRNLPTWFVDPLNKPGTGISTKLPLILITAPTTIPDDPKVEATMKIIYKGGTELNYESDEANVYDGKIGIERRGASSYDFPQRPYALETRDAVGLNLDTALLGMPRENDWVLLSNYNDKSFARNIVSFELFEKMGHYAPRMRLTEMVMNNEYQGIYLFGEKIKKSPQRVAIAKLAEKDTVGTGLTGGYIFKTDYNDGYGTYWTSSFSPLNRPGGTVNYVYHDPKPIELLPQQKKYIAGYVNELESVLYSDYFDDPTMGYRAYIDVNSFIDYFIMCEISRNVDGYKKSRYFYKDKDTRNPLVHSGPTWDYDWAWKNLSDCYLMSNTTGAGWAYQINSCNVSPTPPAWEFRMLQDKAFANAVNARYFNLRQTILSEKYFNNALDSIAALVKEAQVRHYAKYKILGSNSGAPEIDAQAKTYAEEITKLKKWIKTRLYWLDANMVGEYGTAVPEITTQPRLRVFPNPVQDLLYVESDFDMKQITITNTMGMTCRVVNPTELSTGITVSDLAPGVYVVRVVFANAKSFTQKLVKE